MDSDRPLIVQSDRTVLLEVGSPCYAEVRDAIAPFAELEKSPEHIHTYRITPLSVWNAAATGLRTGAILETLERCAEMRKAEARSASADERLDAEASQVEHGAGVASPRTAGE